MDKGIEKREYRVGMEVIVKHDLGLECGTIESVNLHSGKILVFFDYPECPHFASFNINQVAEFKIRKSVSGKC
jgi:hypothetical protein